MCLGPFTASVGRSVAKTLISGFSPKIPCHRSRSGDAASLQDCTRMAVVAANGCVAGGRCSRRASRKDPVTLLRTASQAPFHVRCRVPLAHLLIAPSVAFVWSPGGLSGGLPGVRIAMVPQPFARVLGGGAAVVDAAQRLLPGGPPVAPLRRLQTMPSADVAGCPAHGQDLLCDRDKLVPWRGQGAGIVVVEGVRQDEIVPVQNHDAEAGSAVG